MTDVSKADWLAVEVQDARLQVWAMQGGSALETATAECDPAGLTSASAFDAALKTLTAPWQLPRLPVFVAGLPVGWTDAAPRMVPCTSDLPRITSTFRSSPPCGSKAPADCCKGPRHGSRAF